MAQFGFGYIFFVAFEPTADEKCSITFTQVTISFCNNYNIIFFFAFYKSEKRERIYVRTIDKHLWALVVRLKLHSLRFYYILHYLNCWWLKGAYCMFKKLFTFQRKLNSISLQYLESKLSVCFSNWHNVVCDYYFFTQHINFFLHHLASNQNVDNIDVN